MFGYERAEGAHLVPTGDVFSAWRYSYSACVCNCVCVCVVIPFILEVRFVDLLAGVRGRPHRFLHLPSAVLALILS